MKYSRSLIFTLVLSAIMLLGMVPMMAYADDTEVTTYDLWVGGVQVTSENADSITGDGIDGRVSFDADTNTLTLDSATITGTSVFPYYYTDTYSDDMSVNIGSRISDLTIQLKESNSLTVEADPDTEYQTCIVSDEGNITLTGGEGAALTVSSADAGISVSGALRIEDVTLNGNADLGVIYSDSLEMADCDAYLESTEDFAVNSVRDMVITGSTVEAVTNGGSDTGCETGTIESESGIISIENSTVKVENRNDTSYTSCINAAAELTIIGSDVTATAADAAAVTGLNKITITEGEGGRPCTVRAKCSSSVHGAVTVYADGGDIVFGEGIAVTTPEDGSVQSCAASVGTIVTVCGSDNKPATDVVIATTFYTVTAAETENGTVTLKDADGNIIDKADPEEAVIVTAEPDKYYEVESITYTPEGGSATDITEAGRFTMPEANVIVTVIFKPIEYSITVPETEHGTAKVTDLSGNVLDKAVKDASLMVNAAPAEGYTIDSITYKDPDGKDVDITGAKSFTMPGYDITITVTFKPIEYSVTLADTVNGKAAVTDADGAAVDKAIIGDVIKVSAEPAENYELDKITYTPEGGSSTDITEAGSFTMPAAGVTVTVTFKPLEYSITVSKPEHGTAKVTIDTGEVMDSAPEGTELIVDAIPDEGFRIAKIIWTDADGSETDITDAKSFTMPGCDVTVTVTFEAIEYSITLAETEHGTAEVTTSDGASAETATAGTQLTVTAVPEEGYALDAISYTTESGSETDITETGSFTMPAADVEVTVTFKAIEYDITVADTEHGTVSVKAGGAEVSKAVTGTEITVETEAEAEYEVEKITYTTEGGSETDITDSGSFTMPASNVTVTVTFCGKRYGITAADTEHGTVAFRDASGSEIRRAFAESQVTVETEPEAGYEAAKITYTPDGGSETDITESGSFTMPAADVTVTVTFTAKEYNIELATGDNGTAAAVNEDGEEVSKAVAGTAITVRTEPAEGYEVETIYLIALGRVEKITDTKSFTMPLSNATVAVTFKEETVPDEDPDTDTDPDPDPDPEPSAKISIQDAKVVLTATYFTYNGKVRRPGVKTIGGKTLKKGTDYTLKYSNSASTAVGIYTVTVTGRGKYTGTTKATYRMIPKGTSIRKLKKAKKAITVRWKKQAAKMSKSRITGYQIQLATNKAFTKNNKTVTVRGYKKVSRKVTGLKSKKKYYVRIRTYKTINGRRICSKWSKAKAIRTK